MLIIHDNFLSLIRLGIGHGANPLQDNIDWQAIKDLASRHGLTAVFIDGIECMPENTRPPRIIILDWIGEVLHSYEYRYISYKRTIAELASFYNAHSIKMMVIKGYACSINWPKPEHRPCGDIDIWLFGQQKYADDIVNKEKGISIDKAHQHHTVFKWGDFEIENHFDFVNVNVHKSSAELEVIFKDLGMDDSFWVDVNGEIVYLPSPNLHALFLLRHMLSHFAAAEISFRQLLDWAFFVKKSSKQIDWNWLQSVLEKYHMMEFFNYINAICIEDLGFLSDIFPKVQFNPLIKEKVLNDILSPKYGAEEPNHFIQRMMYKYKRWQGNAWKQKLCYNESRWCTFWKGLWNHLTHPAMI